MDEWVLRIVASAVISCLFCFSSLKMLGGMQQGGYKNGVFWRWVTRKDNLLYNRLSVLALCLTLVSAVAPLCFSFFGEKSALLIASIPFLATLLLFYFADSRYALKVPVKRTGRLMRLFAVYWFITATCSYALMAILHLFATKHGGSLYGLLQYVPVGVLPALLPFFLMLANLITGVFEEFRNKKFVERAGQVLDEQNIIRIGVVGSYGKTSVKHILETLLSEQYEVVTTPESFNTPMGIAKTVFSPDFKGKQIFIAEMGARKKGDIAQLCAMVKPDYAIFTGICEQHVQGFGSLDNVWAEKSEILKCGAKLVVCGKDLRSRIEESFASELGRSIFVESNEGEAHYGAIATAFDVNVYGQKLAVKTSLLGRAGVENIRIAVRLCLELGLTAEDLVKGLEKLKPIPHRLQLIETSGIYVLDDGYNCSPKSAQEAIEALKRFGGRKCIVTPGIIECGVLEEKINGALGAEIAKAGFDKVIFVGETLVGVVKRGYDEAGGNVEKCAKARTLDEARKLLSTWLVPGDAVLFLNDLPDVY